MTGWPIIALGAVAIIIGLLLWFAYLIIAPVRDLDVVMREGSCWPDAERED
jgi:hypothetical protein